MNKENLKEKAKKTLHSLREVRKENKSKISAVEMKEKLREMSENLPTFKTNGKSIYNALQEGRDRKINHFNIGKRIKVQFQKGEISKEKFQDEFDKISSYLTDEEEDEILAPFLLKIIDDIKTGKERLYSAKEVFAKCGIEWDEENMKIKR